MTKKKLKEYERHVLKVKGKAWCEEDLQAFDLPFQSTEHALLTMDAEGRLVPCIECLRAVESDLKEKILSLERG